MRAMIKSNLPTFRRAGIKFSSAGHVVDLAALTEKQVEAIYAEPRLQITLLELPEKAAEVTPPVLSDTGIASPAGGKLPAGAGALHNPASESDTQSVDGGGDAGKESASTEGAATTASGVEVPTGGQPPVGSGNEGADGAISNPRSAAPATLAAKPAKVKAAK